MLAKPRSEPVVLVHEDGVVHGQQRPEQRLLLAVALADDRAPADVLIDRPLPQRGGRVQLVDGRRHRHGDPGLMGSGGDLHVPTQPIGALLNHPQHLDDVT